MTTIRKRARLALLLAIFAGLPLGALGQSAGAPALSQPLGLQEYIAQLDRCVAVLNGSATNPAALHDLRASLPDRWTVRADRTLYTVTTDWLAAGLAAAESDPRPNNPALVRMRQTLAAYREAAQQMEAQNPPQNLPQSRTQLNQILSGKEFRGAEGPSWFDVWKARVWGWIARHLAKWFGGINISHKFSDGIAWTLITLVTLLLIFWAARYLLQTGSRSEMNLRDASALGRNWHYWLREARAAAERGDYRTAIHAAYWAAVTQLEETKSLPEDRSRTPRESLRLIRRESPAYAPLAQLTRRFELVWYGYRSATAADWTDAMQQLEALGCPRSSTPAISAY